MKREKNLKIKLVALFFCAIILLPVLFACELHSGYDLETDETISDHETYTFEQPTYGYTIEIVEPTEAPINDEESYTDETINDDATYTFEQSTYDSTIEIVEPTETPIDDGELHYDKIAREFLESIKSGDYAKVAKLMWWKENTEAYRFIQDMTVDSYEIVETIDPLYNGEYPKYFKVKFNISQSDNDYFTAGESYWDLMTGGYQRDVSLFRPSNYEENIGYISNTHYKDNDYSFCYNFSHYFNIFETANDFDAFFPEDIKAAGGRNSLGHSALHFYYKVHDGEYNGNGEPLYIDVLEDYILKTTGITGIDYTTASPFYDEKENAIMGCGHGWGWKYWIPVSKQYDENTNIYTVVIDYFADTGFLVVAKTIEYKFTTNDDGTYKMLSTELLYDSGYSMAGGGV